MKQPKKLLILNILDILRKYSDADHRLSQKDIADILKRDYDMTVDRKAIRRNLLSLMECGYEIEYSETVRTVTNPKTGEKEESCIWSDFYLERDFSDSELRLLIDGLLFSRHIPYNDCKNLVEKLKNLSNVYFNSHIKHIARMPDDKTDNKHLFLNIELLDEAISKQKKVSFNYAEYRTDKKMHLKKRSDGSTEYIVSPYQMAANDGKYYLICNFDKYDDISNYRLDRIMNLKILDESVKPFKSLIGADGQSLDLVKYMKEHIYMYSNDSARVKFRTVKPMISDVIDIFGKDVTFSDEDEFEVTVSVYTNLDAMKQLAKRCAPDIIILEPQSLADEIKYELEEAVETYRCIGSVKLK